MVDLAALAEVEKRIQVVEDNLRQLQEQAAAYSGAADEERNADRIADQDHAELDRAFPSAKAPTSPRVAVSAAAWGPTMSASGTKRKCQPPRRKSAYGSKADLRGRRTEVAE